MVGVGRICWIKIWIRHVEMYSGSVLKKGNSSRQNARWNCYMWRQVITLQIATQLVCVFFQCISSSRRLSNNCLACTCSNTAKSNFRWQYSIIIRYKVIWTNRKHSDNQWVMCQISSFHKYVSVTLLVTAGENSKELLYI